MKRLFSGLRLPATAAAAADDEKHEQDDYDDDDNDDHDDYDCDDDVGDGRQREREKERWRKCETTKILGLFRNSISVPSAESESRACAASTRRSSVNARKRPRTRERRISNLGCINSTYIIRWPIQLRSDIEK